MKETFGVNQHRSGGVSLPKIKGHHRKSKTFKREIPTTATFNGGGHKQIMPHATNSRTSKRHK